MNNISNSEEPPEIIAKDGDDTGDDLGDDEQITKKERVLGYVSNVFSAVVSSVIFVLFIFIGVKVFKIIRFNNKIILGMIFFLTC